MEFFIGMLIGFLAGVIVGTFTEVPTIVWLAASAVVAIKLLSESWLGRGGRRRW